MRGFAMGPRFADRTEAGRLLAAELGRFSGRDVVVLGIPRGGVVVADEVARSIGAGLDVVIPRKVGAPGNPELGLGAVAPGVEVLDERLIRTLDVGEAYLRDEIASQQREIERRAEAYRRGRPPVDVQRKVAVVVDDGVATGGTAIAALRWAGQAGASRVVLAVPVAPREALDRLRAEADEVVVLAAPEPFYAVGQWYERFGQVEDEEVVGILSRWDDRTEGRGE